MIEIIAEDFGLVDDENVEELINQVKKEMRKAFDSIIDNIKDTEGIIGNMPYIIKNGYCYIKPISPLKYISVDFTINGGGLK